MYNRPRDEKGCRLVADYYYYYYYFFRTINILTQRKKGSRPTQVLKTVIKDVSTILFRFFKPYEHYLCSAWENVKHISFKSFLAIDKDLILTKERKLLTARQVDR